MGSLQKIDHIVVLMLENRSERLAVAPVTASFLVSFAQKPDTCGAVGEGCSRCP